MNGALPNSVSATPSPSVPGSQEATIAFASAWIGAMFIGRPETTSTTHFIARADLVDGGLVRGREIVGVAVADVADALRVRRLADDDDADVEPVIVRKRRRSR